MGTRCIIEVDGCNRYRIYRHYDGYPDAVLADIRKVMEASGLGDPEYFLANFIFLAKWNFWKQGSDWEGTYGVCSPTCEHGGIEFEYKLRKWVGKWMVEIRRHWIDDQNTVTTIYKGELEKAFEKFIKEFKDGCHIRELPEAWKP